jgi:superfamily II RNA helicase
VLPCSLLTQLRAEDADPEALLAASFRQFQLQRALPALKAAIAAKVPQGWTRLLRC